MITGHPHDVMLGTGTSDKEAAGVYALPRTVPDGSTQWFTCIIEAADYWRRFYRDHLAIGLWADQIPGGRGVAIGNVRADGVSCGGGGKVGVIIEDFRAEGDPLFPDTCREFAIQDRVALSLHASRNWIAYQIHDAGGELLADAAARVPSRHTSHWIWIAHTSSFTLDAAPAAPQFLGINDGYF